jgi:hypothetical protein
MIFFFFQALNFLKVMTLTKINYDRLRDLLLLILLRTIFFGIVLVLIILLYALFSSAWTPDTMCQSQANGSIQEYLDCKAYFDNLSTTKNQTVTINNTIYQNSTETIILNNTVSFDSSNFITKSDFENFKLGYYKSSEVDLKDENLKLNMLSSLKDELRTKGWLEQTITYAPNISLEEYAKKKELEDYKGQVAYVLASAGNRSNIGQDSASSIFGGVGIYVFIILIVVGVIFYFRYEKAHRYDNKGSSSEGGPITRKVFDENSELRRLLDEQLVLMKSKQKDFDTQNAKISELSAELAQLKK